VYDFANIACPVDANPRGLHQEEMVKLLLLKEVASDAVINEEVPLSTNPYGLDTDDVTANILDLLLFPPISYKVELPLV
jgi:hypothetical protein